MTSFHEDLNRALQAFVSSSRFGFLKRLQIGPLIGADAHSLGELADLTFEGLLELGADHLDSLTEVQKRVLFSTLVALSEAEAHSTSGSGLEEDTHETIINSVQAEIDLREKLKVLETHPNFQKNKGKKLGAFWASSWERAPFEEAFTLAQLVSMDLATLQKKRTVGPARVVLLAKAVERVIDTLSGLDPDIVRSALATTEAVPAKLTSAPSVSSRPLPRAVSLSVEEPRLHPWMLEIGKFSIPEAALLEHVLELPLRLQTAGAPKAGLVATIATVFSASEIVHLAQLREPAKALLKKLKSWLAGAGEDGMVMLLQEALQGPGVHIEKVLSLLSLNEWTPSCARLISVMILRAVGAQPIRYNSQECSEVYSLNPGLAHLIVSGLKGSTKSQSAFSNLLHAACPAMDPFLHSWLCLVVKAAKRR